MDRLDRTLVNRLQDGFPVCDSPYAEVAREFGISEAELLGRLETLIDDGTLSRFGPMFDAERMGGAFSLCALQVPAERYTQTTEVVNSFPEVAHNYERSHSLNMWFVLATESRERLAEVAGEIERHTGLHVYQMPKLEEFYVGLRFNLLES
jgi:DNA-binding Lrp family transcriptional regulator